MGLAQAYSGGHVITLGSSIVKDASRKRLHSEIGVRYSAWRVSDTGRRVGWVGADVLGYVHGSARVSECPRAVEASGAVTMDAAAVAVPAAGVSWCECSTDASSRPLRRVIPYCSGKARAHPCFLCGCAGRSYAFHSIFASPSAPHDAATNRFVPKENSKIRRNPVAGRLFLVRFWWLRATRVRRI